MSENDMAKIARLVADPHADKDAEINRAEHAAAIAEFNEKAALRHIAALEARVAELEAALKEARIEFEMWHEAKNILAKIDAALSETVET